MKKKLLMFSLAVVVIASLVCFGCAPEEAPPTAPPAEEEVIHWKVQDFVPAGLIFYEYLERLAADVEELSGGRLIFDLYPAGALYPPFEGIVAASDGTVDADCGYFAEFVGKIPCAPLFCSIPGGFDAWDMAEWMYYGGGTELQQEIIDNHGYNVKVIPCGIISMEIFMWADKPLRKVEDFEGVKMRMMPLMGDILSAHGFSVAFVPGGEILPDLERGVLDAAEYSIPAFDCTAGYHEVRKYYHMPGLHQPTGVVQLYINKDSWNALPDDLKAVVEHASYENILDSWLYGDSENIKALETFKAHGNELVVMDPETVATFTKWAEDYMDEMAAKDPEFAKVRESQKAFAAKWYPYKEAMHIVR